MLQDQGGSANLLEDARACRKAAPAGQRGVEALDENVPDITTHPLISVRVRGAFIMINHLCDAVCSFMFDPQALRSDWLAVLNGPMRGSILMHRTVGWR
jgi:hypothetical protein